MRLVDVILILVVVAAAVMQMTRLSERWAIALTSLSVLLCIWHVIQDGIYWQLLPVMGALVLLVIWQLTRRRSRPSPNPASNVRVALAAVTLSALSFGMLLLVPMFALPKPTGPYRVGTRILYLKDSSRIEDRGGHPGMPRELIVQVWYPAATSNNHLAAYQRRLETSVATSYRSVLWTDSKADAPIATNGGPFNVLLFNHAWGGRRTQDTFLTEDLASHGFVVAAIDHTYNAGRVQMPDNRVLEDTFGYDPINPAARTGAQILDVWNKELSTWVADEVFVLNTLQQENLDEKSFWFGRLDTGRAAALGHSFGGAASVQVCSVDPRIRSALNLDGWTFGDIRHRASGQPIMFLYAAGSRPRPQELTSTNPTVRTEAELGVRDMQQIDPSLKQYGGYKLYVDNTSHMDFTDHPLVSPWRRWTDHGHILPAQIQTIVRTYALAFFDETLRGEKPALLQSGDSSPFHEVQIEQFIPDSKTESVEAVVKRP